MSTKTDINKHIEECISEVITRWWVKHPTKYKTPKQKAKHQTHKKNEQLPCKREVVCLREVGDFGEGLVENLENAVVSINTVISHAQKKRFRERALE
jgi:hypothetical protein